MALMLIAGHRWAKAKCLEAAAFGGKLLTGPAHNERQLWCKGSSSVGDKSRLAPRVAGLRLLLKQCAVKGAGLQRVQLPPGNWFAPPGSNRSGSGGNEAVGAFGVEGR
jgi:hypothetical protein